VAASYRLSKAELKVAEDEATAKANELGSDLWQESYDALPSTYASRLGSMAT
jgi:hypothetical protein